MMTFNKVILFGYNAKLGMKLILDCYALGLCDYSPLRIVSDKNYSSENESIDVLNLSNSSSHILMALDFLNIFKAFRIAYLLFMEKSAILFFVSAHPMNVSTALIARVLNLLPGFDLRVISHIHDVTPHSRTQNASIIDAFQKLQVKLSHRIFVYGDFLKDEAKVRFSRAESEIFSYLLGVPRTIKRSSAPRPISLKYMSLIGRIDRYKGIDTFLELARRLDGKEEINFLLAGSGDLSSYRERIENLNNITVVNRFLSNEEMDEMLLSSYALLLPYHDASQSAMTPVAYYNACPVIVSNVGGLPETVEHGKTGFVFQPGAIDELEDYTTALFNDNSLRSELSLEAFRFYKVNLDWGGIFEKLAAELQQPVHHDKRS